VPGTRATVEIIESHLRFDDAGFRRNSSQSGTEFAIDRIAADFRIV
jgi:hypothetical protein